MFKLFSFSFLCIFYIYIANVTGLSVILLTLMLIIILSFRYAVANHFVFSYKTFSHNADKDIDP